MPSWESTTPAVIDALTALWGSLDCDVVDGPAVSGSSRRAALMVGWNDTDPEGTAVDGTSEREGFGSGLRERYSLTCTLRTRSGGAQNAAWATQRAALFSLYGAACLALAGDSQLGGLVNSANPGSWSLTQVNGQKGRDAVLIFDITIDAYAK